MNIKLSRGTYLWVYLVDLFTQSLRWSTSFWIPSSPRDKINHTLTIIPPEDVLIVEYVGHLSKLLPGKESLIEFDTSCKRRQGISKWITGLSLHCFVQAGRSAQHVMGFHFYHHPPTDDQSFLPFDTNNMISYLTEEKSSQLGEVEVVLMVFGLYQRHYHHHRQHRPQLSI